VNDCHSTYLPKLTKQNPGVIRLAKFSCQWLPPWLHHKILKKKPWDSSLWLQTKIPKNTLVRVMVDSSTTYSNWVSSGHMNRILSYGAGCGVYQSIKNGMYYMYLLAQSALSAVHSSIIPPPNYTYPLKPPPTYTQGVRPDGQTPRILYTMTHTQRWNKRAILISFLMVFMDCSTNNKTPKLKIQKSWNWSKHHCKCMGVHTHPPFTWPVWLTLLLHKIGSQPNFQRCVCLGLHEERISGTLLLLRWAIKTLIKKALNPVPE
jgi:hypothetical protein